MTDKVSFFMGANTPKGFFSLFDGLYDPFEKQRCYILKGGPGTGKSTFMRRIGSAAENRGYSCEYIFCASDPESLDALIIPSLGVCLADGTAPHVLEPVFPGAVERLIDLGAYWDEKKLFPYADEIRRLTLEISSLHARSLRFISAAGMLRSDTRRISLEAIDEAKVCSFAVRLARRELGGVRACPGPGSEKRRFLSAVTPKGIYSHSKTVRALCSRVIGIDDEYAAGGGLLLERVKNEALNLGRDVISCPCPMEPEGYPEHLLIPDEGLAIISLRQAHTLEVKPDRVIHVSRFFRPDALSGIRCRSIFNKTAARELLSEAVESMKCAKNAHDKLESYYVNAMDFKSADLRCKETIKQLFGK